MDTLREVVTRMNCAVWGHAVDNRVFRSAHRGSRKCRCGARYLSEDGTVTRVRHTLSCFLRHHTYVLLAKRHGHHEYVCVRCGHPLVFAAAADRFANRDVFDKKVRYACGLFGHRVHRVTERDGFVEYTCFCGHSFLKDDDVGPKVRHPLICFFTAHRIRFVSRRAGHAEYVCRDCGHPFCFADPASVGRAERADVLCAGAA
jgi:DNA-directed RNA polymerase subunit RPC12/RpoP